MVWICWQKRNIDMVLIKIFISFFKISLYAIGGAYSFVPVIEHEIVENCHWLTKNEFLEVLGMSNVLPGAISIKFASYVGYKVAGLPGACVAIFANTVSTAVLIICVFNVLNKYKDMPVVNRAVHMIHFAVFAMIIAVALDRKSVV